MGKSFPSNKTRLQQLTKNASQVIGRTATKQTKSTQPNRKPGEVQVEDKRLKKMESSSGTDNNSNECTRVPLSEVVSDCVKRWFKDTLKEAKAGDINMQVLVGQMYYSGYGVARDTQKVFSSL